MKIAIVYDSRTGTTAAAARAMAKEFSARGHTCDLAPVASAEPAEVKKADLICIGSWTVGLVLFGQRPTRETMAFVHKLDNLCGRKAVVFCTYKVATGKLLPRLAEALQMRGGRVVGSFKFRGARTNREFASFARQLPS